MILYIKLNNNKKKETRKTLKEIKGLEKNRTKEMKELKKEFKMEMETIK